MRIEYHEATGCPFGQFVVYAESEVDGAIIKAFFGGQQFGWKFCHHGTTYGDGQTRSFNFGWQKADAA